MADRRGTRSRRADPLERSMEQALEPGHFISRHQEWDFVSGLEEVEKELARLVRDDPLRAVTLYETFLAGCYEKAGEIDDSSGSFGMFIDGLFCGWAKARETAGCDPRETAEHLLAWMDDDPYGFAYQLERKVAKVLHRRERKALADAVRTRFEAAATAKDTGDQRDTFLRSRWGDALRTIHAAQRDIKAYVAVCEETELLPADCEVVAKILQARGKIEDALAWVDRGLGGKETERWGRGSSCDLVDMKRSLLKKLGRDEEALKSAWQEFVEHPGKFTYEELMKYVPKGKRAFWHEKAMEISAKADLSPALELFLESRETERLLERLRMASKEDLESLSHYVAGPAASKIQRSHPEVAAKLFADRNFVHDGKRIALCIIVWQEEEHPTYWVRFRTGTGVSDLDAWREEAYARLEGGSRPYGAETDGVRADRSA